MRKRQDTVTAPPLRLRALCVDLTIDVQDGPLAAIVQDVLQDLVTTAMLGDPRLEASLSGSGPFELSSPRRSSRSWSRSSALAEVLAAVNVNLVEHSPLLTLHAAVLTRAGRTLVLPAASGTGKSTLCAALLQRGWSYVSDEALALDWGPTVLPYARPLALSPWSVSSLGSPTGREASGEHVLRAADFGASINPKPGPVTDIVLLRREGHDFAPRLLEVGRGEVVGALLRRGFTHMLDLPLALAVLSEVVRDADVAVLAIGPPQYTADILDRALP